jgi:hypothetical protein
MREIRNHGRDKPAAAAARWEMVPAAGTRGMQWLRAGEASATARCVNLRLRGQYLMDAELTIVSLDPFWPASGRASVPQLTGLSDDCAIA